MIERDGGRALVTDFGIARHTNDPHSGDIVGTADYMSPEQTAGQPVHGRSDIHSLGVTAFYAITGRLPFRAATEEHVLILQEIQSAPSVIGLRAGVPGRLAEIIARCLAKDPADRFQTAEEFAAALGDIAGAVRRMPAVVHRFLQLAQNTSRRLMVLAPVGGVMAYALGLTLAVAAMAVAIVSRSTPEALRLGLMSVGVCGIILAMGAVGWAVFSLVGSGAGRSTEHGVWLGPFGRRFFALAAIGLSRVPIAERPSIRRPEALLSQAVRSALADLGGLPQRTETLAVIDELEVKIGALRAERDAVAVMPRGRGAPAAPERADRETLTGADDARLVINRQIEEAIEAFESVRLDLLRIRSGVGSHDDLESSLTEARKRAAVGSASP